MSHFDFERVVPRTQTVETEVAERIGLRLRDLDAVAEQGDVDGLHAIDDAIGRRGDASADEAGFPALEAAVPDARLGAQVRPAVTSSPSRRAFSAIAASSSLTALEDVGRADCWQRG